VADLRALPDSFSHLPLLFTLSTTKDCNNTTTGNNNHKQPKSYTKSLQSHNNAQEAGPQEQSHSKSAAVRNRDPAPGKLG
jgi:hypothetical protein